MTYRIPFNKPYATGVEMSYVAQCIAEAKLSGDGRFTRQCQELMQTQFSASHVLLTTSGTSALEMAALLCNMEPGDEVIMPSYTFVSTANAFVLRGARPVFVDIRRDTLNIDESLIEQAITPRTRAIAPVHYAGVGCEMDTINAIAKRHDLRVVEDAAQGVNATYRGAYLGTLGDYGAYSFHETKNFVCGEGGALVTNRLENVARAEIIREKGTNRSQFFRGQVDKYTWVDVGSSYLPADVLAAFLLAQLQQMEQITAQRKRVYETYRHALQPLADRRLLTLPTIPAHCSSNYHMFYVIVENLDVRTALIEHLRRAGILAVFHYIPLHTSPVGLSFGYRQGMLPVTETSSERLLRLPLFPTLTAEDLDGITGEIQSFYSVPQRRQGRR